MTTSRMRSKGSIWLSSRRPTARVMTRIRKKTKMVRRTTSMADQGKTVMSRSMAAIHVSASSSSRPQERGAVGAVRGVRGVDLDVQPDDEPLAGVDGVVAEDQAPVAAGFADRAGL